MENRILDVESQIQMIPNQNEPTSIFKKANRLVTLKFDDVVYKVRPKKGIKTNSESEEKTILKGISGIVRPGEMLAMLGPSGSGKTTLLTALGGRLATGKLTGNITYNSKPFSNALKRNTGFVTQDDILYPHLTVSETLIYTALLRLPNTLTTPEKIAHAEAVITELNLTRCKNSIIGGLALRGISGGERKRVSIGQEMLINPSLLLLDEPTSGLDSTTALRIVSTLWDLAQGGRTVVMTIHQPSSRLFYMFHKLLLLSEGNSLYYGTGSAAMEYFATIGYSPSVPMNPSDFLLDIANGILPSEGQEPGVVKQSLLMAYQININEKLKAEIIELDQYQQNLDMSSEDMCNMERWPTTWWQQFTILLNRGVKVRRHESFSGLKIGQVLAVALLCGCLWWQSGISHLQDQMGLLFFIASFWGFYPLFQAIFTFPKEIMMLYKERSSGMYRLSSYFMSRMIADLPMELVLPTIFLSITYWMAGLNPAFQNFLWSLLVLLFCVLVSQSLGLALGAIVMDLQSATVLGSVIMLSFLLAGGFYVQNVPPFIAWIKYVSIGRYSYKLLIQAQYDAWDRYPCGGNGKLCYVGDFEPIKKVGLDGEVASVVALAVMLVGYRLMAYMALTRVGKTKQ